MIKDYRHSANKTATTAATAIPKECCQPDMRAFMARAEAIVAIARVDLPRTGDFQRAPMLRGDDDTRRPRLTTSAPSLLLLLLSFAR